MIWQTDGHISRKKVRQTVVELGKQTNSQADRSICGRFYKLDRENRNILSKRYPPPHPPIPSINFLFLDYETASGWESKKKAEREVEPYSYQYFLSLEYQLTLVTSGYKGVSIMPGHFI
jgi:hypothetical protein